MQLHILCSEKERTMMCTLIVLVLIYASVCPSELHLVEEEFILNSGESRNFSCTGNKPLSWYRASINYEESAFIKTDIDSIEYTDSNFTYYESIISINNANIGDISFYICQQKNDSTILKIMYIYVRDANHLSIFNTSMQLIPVGKDMKNIIIPCRPTSPEVEVFTEDSFSNEIFDEKNYDPRIGFKYDKYLMTQISDSIDCVFKKDRKTETVTFVLHVVFEPRVTIESNYLHKFNETTSLQCEIEASPPPVIEWFFKPCTNDSCFFEKIPSYMFNIEYFTIRHTSTLNIIANKTGLIKCFANNALGEDSSTIDFFVTDEFIDLHVWRLNDELMISAGDQVEIYCSVPIYKYSNNIEWFIRINNTWNKILKDKNYSIINNKTEFTYKSTLKVQSISLNQSGIYACKPTLNPSYKIEDNAPEANISIYVHEAVLPKIEKTNLNGTEIIMDTGAYLELFCYASGIPRPEIIWKMDNEYLSNNSHLQLSDDNSRLIFYYLDVDDTGEYSCKAENRIGSDKRIIRIIAKSPINFKLTIIVTTLSFCSVLLLVLLITKIRKFRLLKKSGILNFEEGDLKNLNPDLELTEQVDLLPYDAKWEFPRNQLKIGEQLGFGAFGVVMKAEAIGIIKGQITTTVAVKMVKQSVKYSDIKALASELKIMIHMGKHLNIVNLLGACTKNVTKRELLVIVEYCKFGNLYNYLRSHRDNFINQIDADTGLIDFSKTFIKSTDHYYLTPKHLEAKRNEKTDENDLVILTKDLISWSFQIARGMDYLANKKVLHGDLAARNILLAENNVVKICDFGLSKNLYYKNNYKKKKNIPLPVKWMAVESIWDRVFSTQSDVWSYGVVLWELFSLAETPYPFMVANQNFFIKLKDGYRMEQPQYSTTEIYEIMLDCWQMKPSCRPSFAELVEKFENILESSICKVYLNLAE